VPCAGAPTVVTDRASPSMSESFASTATETGPSSPTVAASSTATGASFTGKTVRETVAVFESALPSFTLNVNESGPLKFGSGV
jgi:hypothetical protein